MGFLKSQKRKSKWYKCFKPKKHAGFPFEPVSDSGNGGKEGSLVRDNVIVTSPDSKLDFLSDGEDRFNDKKSKYRRRLSRAFRAVLFPASLAKRNRSGKSDEQEKSFRSISDLSAKVDKIFSKKSSSPLMYEDSTTDSGLGTDSSGPSSLFSSSSVTPASFSLSSSRSSSVACNSRSPSARKRSIALDLRQLEKKPSTIYPKRCFNSIVVLYFLLICLVALLLGKAFAIFCTSTSLFLVPSRFIKGVDQSSSCNNIDSVDIN